MGQDLVKFIDYDGWLPKPTALPGRIATIKGYPFSICDGNALDLIGNHTGELEVNVSANIKTILSELEDGHVLTCPLYVCDDFFNMQAFVLFNPNKEPIVVQTKYYQYFYYRYKGCQFKGKGGTDPVGVLCYGRIVGVIMPIAADIEIPYYEGGTE